MIYKHHFEPLVPLLGRCDVSFNRKRSDLLVKYFGRRIFIFGEISFDNRSTENTLIWHHSIKNPDVYFVDVEFEDLDRDTSDSEENEPRCIYDEEKGIDMEVDERPVLTVAKGYPPGYGASKIFWEEDNSIVKDLFDNDISSREGIKSFAKTMDFRYQAFTDQIDLYWKLGFRVKDCFHNIYNYLLSDFVDGKAKVRQALLFMVEPWKIYHEGKFTYYAIPTPKYLLRSEPRVFKIKQTSIACNFKIYMQENKFIEDLRMGSQRNVIIFELFSANRMSDLFLIYSLICDNIETKATVFMYLFSYELTTGESLVSGHRNAGIELCEDGVVIGNELCGNTALYLISYPDRFKKEIKFHAYQLEITLIQYGYPATVRSYLMRMIFPTIFISRKVLRKFYREKYDPKNDYTKVLFPYYSKVKNFELVDFLEDARMRYSKAVSNEYVDFLVDEVPISAGSLNILLQIRVEVNKGVVLFNSGDFYSKCCKRIEEYLTDIDYVRDQFLNDLNEC